MKNILILCILISLYSCEKDNKHCMYKKTAIFYVDNQSKSIAHFTLIQESDTINTEVYPGFKHNFIIRAGVITKSYVYVADTLYRKTMDNWKSKRCEIDGHLIR